jgi:hypothetical protein
MASKVKCKQGKPQLAFNAIPASGIKAKKLLLGFYWSLDKKQASFNTKAPIPSSRG